MIRAATWSKLVAGVGARTSRRLLLVVLRWIVVCCRKQSSDCLGWAATSAAHGSDTHLQDEMRARGWWLPRSPPIWKRAQCPECQ